MIGNEGMGKRGKMKPTSRGKIGMEPKTHQNFLLQNSAAASQPRAHTFGLVLVLACASVKVIECVLSAYLSVSCMCLCVHT